MRQTAVLGTRAYRQLYNIYVILTRVVTGYHDASNHFAVLEASGILHLLAKFIASVNDVWEDQLLTHVWFNSC